MIRTHFLVMLLLPLIMGGAVIDQPGFYRFKVGQYEVVALSDGTVPLDAEQLLKNNVPGKVTRLLSAAYLNNPIEISINEFLVNIGGRVILIDAGAGELFGPNHGGRLVSSLRAAGYQPEQITDILLTHIHNDHSGGLSIKGKAVFPNAIVHVNKLDMDYWLDQQRMEKADPHALSSNKSSFINAHKTLDPYIAEGRVKTFEGDIELFPGIRSMATGGHTPGHTVFVLDSGNDKLLFWGDLIHVGGVQFADPTIPDGFDVDKEKAIATRIRLYGEAAKQGYLIAADHLSFPGVGRLRAKESGFEWMPIPYSLEGRTK